jgi:hypothetical protein
MIAATPSNPSGVHLSCSFVVTRTSGTVYEQNFAISPCLKDSRVREVIVQQGFSSATLAYNDAIAKAQEDILIFCHQDMYFPEAWLDDLQQSIRMLEKTDPSWAVLGCWGVTEDGKGIGYIHSFGHGTLGAPFTVPQRINTLDECVLILRKSSGLTFDPELPDFHFYGTDICLAARKAGLCSYVISAFCIHNTRTLRMLPPEYFDGYFHIKKVWRQFLPIYTACANVTRFDRDFYRYRARRLKYRLLGKDLSPAERLDDPRKALLPAGGPGRGEGDPAKEMDLAQAKEK